MTTVIDPATPDPGTVRVEVVLTVTDAARARCTLLTDLGKGYYDAIPEAEATALAFIFAVDHADGSDDDEPDRDGGGPVAVAPARVRLVVPSAVWDQVLGMLEEDSPLWYAQAARAGSVA